MYGEIYNSLRTNLCDKEYAEGYAESFLNSYIATQIKVIREQRKMTQAQLGDSIGTTQAGVSRYENVDYSSWSLRTLQKIAHAFDVRLKVSFEPYGTLPDEVIRFDRKFLEREERKNDSDLQRGTSDVRASLAPDRRDLVDIGAYKALKSCQTDYQQEGVGGSLGYAASGNF